MTFNMLDDDFIPEEDGYTPSFIGGSRTGNMKKLAKKQERPSTANLTLQKPATLKPPAQNDNLDNIDDLLDQLMESKQKSNNRPNTSIMKNGIKNTSAFDDLKFSDDSGFGPKESITFNIEKTLPKPFDVSKSNFNGKDTFKLSDDLPMSSFDKKSTFIINDDHDASPIRSRRESNVRKESPKNIIIEDDAPSMTIGSSRMMRPPIGRKNSTHNQPSDNDHKPQSSMFYLNDQTVKLTQTAEPSKFGRRGSISSQLAKEQPKEELKIPNYLTQDQPKLSRQSSFHFQDKSQQKIVIEKPVQRIVERIVEKIVEGPKVDVSGMQADHQKQINMIKESYEKQIKILTESFQRQIKEEKDAKAKIMSDMKQLLEKERQNHQKIIKQEADRYKKMNDWEKDKFETTYKSQIERLKSIVSTQQKSIPQPSVSYLQKRRIQDLEQKLKYQMETVEAQKKKLSKIESDLDQRQVQFNKFRTSEEQRFKQEYTKNSQKALKDMKKVSEEKNEVATQKQKLAVEMAQLEMDFLQRKEKLTGQEEALKLNQQNFERTRYDSEMLNQQLYNSYKTKLQDAEQSKKNALLLENQLLNKLKIVQLKGRQVYKGQVGSNLFTNNSNPSKTTHHFLQRPHSVNQQYRETPDNSNRLKKVQSYMKTQALSNLNRTALGVNSSFTLDKFIKNVDGYKKQKRGGIY